MVLVSSYHHIGTPQPSLIGSAVEYMLQFQCFGMRMGCNSPPALPPKDTETDKGACTEFVGDAGGSSAENAGR